MVVLNQTGEEINAKIVYYGPGLSGKTTNLETIHSKLPESARGQMVSMKTRTDRTLFFDFVPVELGAVGGYPLRVLLYTVPGQVYYNATRKLVLRGVDAVVFVADSSRAMLQENIDSLGNLEENLNELGLSLDHLPWVIQYNKRDLPDAIPVGELHEHLNILNVPAYEATANAGTGVYETFRGIAGLLYSRLKKRLDRGELVGSGGPAGAVPPGEPVPAPASALAGTPSPVGPGASGRASADPVPGMEGRQPGAQPATTDAGQSGAIPVAAAAALQPGDESVDDAIDSALRELDVSPADHSGTSQGQASHAQAVSESGRSPLVDATRAREVAGGAANGEEMVSAVPGEIDDVGRVVEFDEVVRASEAARNEPLDDFITDPMGAGHVSSTGAADAPASPPDADSVSTPAHAPTRVAEPGPVTIPPQPKSEPNAGTAAARRESKPPVRMPSSVHVPVIIKRSQLGPDGTVRVVLDVRLQND